MTLLFSYHKRFHVFGGSSPTWIKTNFLLGLSQVFPWDSALESVRYDFGTFRMFLILYSFLLLDVYLCIIFCGNPNVCRRIVHPLLISHLRHNYNLVNDLCSLNRCYEARHHLIVRLKTFECFKLLICAITCLQNLIRKKVQDFYRGQTFWVKLSARFEWLLDRHQSHRFS